MKPSFEELMKQTAILAEEKVSNTRQHLDTFKKDPEKNAVIITFLEACLKNEEQAHQTLIAMTDKEK